MANPDFLPSDEDVLRARSVTTGVVTSGFKVEDATVSVSVFKGKYRKKQ